MAKQQPQKDNPAQIRYKPTSGGKAYQWLMVFFACGCTFVIGVLVGRSTAPVFDVEKIENQLAGLQVSVLQKKEDLQKTIQEYLPQIEELNVLDHLKEKGQTPEVYHQYIPPVKTRKYDKTPPAIQPPAQPQEEQVAGQNEKTDTAQSAQPPEPVEQAEPDEQTQEVLEEKNIEPPKKPAAGDYTIQVAATKDSNKAKTITNRFREKGYPAYCQASNIKGEQWFRIRIGPYPDRATLEKDRSRLREAGVEPIVFILEP